MNIKHIKKISIFATFQQPYMEADQTFHFYCNNDGRNKGRNEYTLRKSQVTLD